MLDKKAFFNRTARIWDAAKIPDAGKISTMLSLSDIRPGSRMLDVGCGTGTLAPYLLKYRPQSVLGVDFAPGMIKEAERKLKDPKVRFICSDIYDLTSRTAVFDYCFFYNSFLHIEDPQRLAAHIAGLMDNGGRVIISHTQGKKTTAGGITLPGVPARELVSLLSPYLRTDVIIDNNVLFMVSGVVITRR